MSPVAAYIGLGSNLDDPERQVREGLLALAQLPRTQLARASQFYRSAPLGPGDQPDYINAVAAIDTRLGALELLEALFAIEQAHGRVRTVRWGPRTLDLDLLLYGNLTLASERLTLPHPRLTERNFVLVPLAEIAPDLVLPNTEPVAQLAQRCSREGLQPLGKGAVGA
jgi:2-amino-4-hydroxy-6-hydroxymethyldihydropteridine diphosphokinase